MRLRTICGTRYSELNATRFWNKVGCSPPDRVFKSVGMQPRLSLFLEKAVSGKILRLCIGLLGGAGWMFFDFRLRQGTASSCRPGAGVARAGSR